MFFAIPAVAQTVQVPYTVAADGRLYADVRIAGKTVHALIDTGASTVTVPKDVYLPGLMNRITITMADGHTAWVNESNQEVCFAGSCSWMHVTQGQTTGTVVPMFVLNQWNSVMFDRKSREIGLSD